MRSSTLTFALAMVLLLFGNSFSKAQSLTWEEIGPNNTGNHVRAMTVGADGTVWAGSVGGGLWKSTDRGSSWTLVSGLSDNLAVSCISIDGSRIVVGTGEGYFYRPDAAWGITVGAGGNWAVDSISSFKNGFLRYTSQPGEGVFISNDGGVTWNHDNGTWNSGSTRYTGNFMCIQKVATQNGKTLIGTHKGLYWSSDADLATVTKSNGTTPFMTRVITDVDFAANGVIYAATDDSLYRSTDGGVNFEKGITNIPTYSAPQYKTIGGERVELAVAPSNPSTMYVTGVSEVNQNCNGVFKSIDNGYTWTSISPYESATFKPCQNKGLYSLVLGVAPNDPGTCYIGGRKMYQYNVNTGWTDAASHSYFPGGSTRYVPVPQTAIAFAPNSDSTFYVGGDAEIVRSFNLGRTYSFATKGFNAAHLMGISASPSFKVLTSDRYSGLAVKDNAFASQNQQQFNSIHASSLTGGGVARFSLTHPNFMISSKAEAKGSSLQRSLTEGSSYEDFYGLAADSANPCLGTDTLFINRRNSGAGGGEIYDFSYQPINPFFMDEYIPADSLGNDTSIQNCPIYVYLATGHYIWVCSNPFGGVDSLPTWDRISTRLINPTDALFGGKKKYFTAMTGSGDANHILYVATNAGEIYRIMNANDPYNICVTTDVARIDGGTLPQRWITSLAIDPNNPNIMLVTFGGYAPGDSRVYISLDVNATNPTFTAATTGLEADLPVYCAAFHPDPTQPSIVLGTEEGVWFAPDGYQSGNPTWSQNNNGIGNVPVMDLNYRRYYMEYIDGANYRYSPDNTLFAATQGRGAFKSSTLVSAPAEQPGLSGITLKAGPNPAMASTKITFDLPLASDVKLEAYSIDGRPVAQIADGRFGTGSSEVVFKTKDLPAGIYLVNAVFTNSKGVFQHNLRIVVLK